MCGIPYTLYQIRQSRLSTGFADGGSGPGGSLVVQTAASLLEDGYQGIVVSDAEAGTRRNACRRWQTERFQLSGR